MFKHLVQIVIGLTLLTTSALCAQESREVEITLPSGAETSFEIFGDSRTRLLWIPSEFSSINQNERDLIKAVASEGFEVWLVNLHETYFIAPGRYSYSKIPVTDIKDLIHQFDSEQSENYILSTGRGSRLMLEGTRLWQLEYPNRKPLSGMIMFHPNLVDGITGAGEPLNYHPIASNTDLPIYIFQPELSSKFWYLKELRQNLEAGGSSVYIHPLQGVSDGFQVRDDASDDEKASRVLLPRQIRQATRLLTAVNQIPRQPAADMSVQVDNQKIQPFAGLQSMHAKAPPLVLNSIKHGLIDLEQLRGNVVVVNFWATWCPPCVKEIPSLGRLNSHYANQPFKVISVDIGEPQSRIETFLKKVPAFYPVMMDEAGESIRSWRVSAFPTTYVIDHRGQIRYGYYGGLEWDSPEVIAIIDPLIDNASND